MTPPTPMHVEVVLALPRDCRTVVVRLAEGATAGDAHRASGLPDSGVDGYAVFGVRVGADARLHHGDRLELLRPLVADPKEARRLRAKGQER